jgi:hypothetical protein
VIGLASALPAPARAEGVEARARLPASATRIRGASSVRPTPGGLVSLGGSQLRVLPTGKKKWQTLHTVKGDNLYRVAADDRGRILASWEEDASFHLFEPGKERQSFPKPTVPGADLATYSLGEIYFDDGGQDALVYMHGFANDVGSTVVGFRYPLDGKTAPTELFRQTGYQLLSTPRLAVFAVSKDKDGRCEHNFCNVAALVAWEVGDPGVAASKKVLVDGQKREFGVVRLVWGSDRERVAIILHEHRKGRYLVRWRRGDAQAQLSPLPEELRYESEATWLTRGGDVLEVWIPDDRSLQVWRIPPKGEMQVTTLPPLGKDERGERRDFSFYGLKERKNGDLIMHWGDFLFFLAADATGPAPAVPLGSLIKGNPEWAGALIYVPDPEALWLGIEMGGGRDYVHLKLADLEKIAKPLP